MVSQKSFTRLYIPLALFLAALIWKLFHVNVRDICLDEPFTIFHAQLSFSEILKLPAQNEPNPPLFMALLHFWMNIFGNGPFSVRILPLLFNALTPVLLYLTVKKLSNLWGGLISAGLFLFSSYHFYYALEARAYSMLSCATAASLFFFISLIKNASDKRFLWGLIISNIIMIYSHYFGWFVVFVQAFLALLYLKDKIVFRRLFISLLATGVSFIPMAIVFVKQFFHSNKGTWVSPPGADAYLNQLKQFFNSGSVFKIMFMLVLIGGFIILLNRSQIKKNFKMLVITLLWWWVPYSLMFLVSDKVPMFISRYVLFNTVGLFVFCGFVISLAAVRYKWVSLGMAVFVSLLMFLKMELFSKEYYYREVQNTVSHVNELVTDSSIVIIHPHWTSLGFSYYFNRELFSNVKHYDSLLPANNLFPVWNVDFVKDIIKETPHSRVVFYQDGSLFSNKNNTIFKFLDSNYVRVDSAFYPQCFYVSAFDVAD